MSLQDSIRTTYYNQAKEGGDSSALRKLRTEIQFILTKTGQNSLSDDEIIRIIKKEIRQRRENSAAYHKAGFPGLSALEDNEEKVLFSVLPPEIQPAEITREAEKLIAGFPEHETLSPSRIMGSLMKVFIGRNIDGRLAHEIVENLLEK